jgi:hypothetical protein
VQPTEARDIGDALDDRPVPAVWPRPTHVGGEKCLADYWIFEAVGLDVALKLATEGSKACIRKVEARRNAAKAAGRAYAVAGVERWLRRVGSLTTGVPESLERNPGSGVGSGQRCS